jgi:hypothetical protein
MCNACGFFCCGSDVFDACGCDHCDCPECWSDDEDDYDASDDGGFSCEEVEPEPASGNQQSGA